MSTEKMPEAWKPFADTPAQRPVMSSPSITKIAEALLKAQRDIKKAAKHSENPHFKSKYADLSEVMDACAHALNANEIVLLQPAKADGANVQVTTMLLHTSGEWLAESLTLVAMQHTPQAVGSCITYGRRYGLASLVGVAQQDDDGEEASTAPRRGRRETVRVSGPNRIVKDSEDLRPPAHVSESTGEEAPEGAHFVQGYRVSGQWHDIVAIGLDGDGGNVLLSTKFPEKAGPMKEACEQHFPVTIDWTPKRGKPGEGYLNKLEPVGAF